MAEKKSICSLIVLMALYLLLLQELWNSSKLFQNAAYQAVINVSPLSSSALFNAMGLLLENMVSASNVKKF